MHSLSDNATWIIVGYFALGLVCALLERLWKLKERFGIPAYRLYRVYWLAFLVAVTFSGCSAAGFPRNQSAVLACISALTAFIGAKFSAQRPPQFQPFRVQILAQWRALLEDHGFIDNDAQWEQLRAEAEGNKSRAPIDFTVLAPDLFYYNPTRHFFRRLGINEELTELRPREKVEVGWGLEAEVMGPTFYVREMRPGFLRGVSEEQKIRPVWTPYWEFGFITYEPKAEHEIPLARLPMGVFNEYYGIELSPRKEEKLAKDLEQLGWKWHHGELDEPPFTLHHRYLLLTYSGINSIGGQTLFPCRPGRDG